MRALLVEPDYKVKYPNLALMKLSTKLKREGVAVEFFKGEMPMRVDSDNNYDEIYITSLFTYDAEIVLHTIKHYQKRNPDARIRVGGVFATLNAELVRERTGIEPFIGYSKELDQFPPDYSLIPVEDQWKDFSFVFTTRGCINKCAFCAVRKLEPDAWINPTWKEHIDASKKNIMVSDNNLTSFPIEHFEDVCRFLKESGKGVVFDNGLDCREFTEQHLSALKGIRFLRSGLRFAFDTMASDGHIQRALKMCIDGGVAKNKLMVYVLFNFRDAPEEAEYRMREIVKLGCRPYPQRYTPLDKLARQPPYVGEHWTDEIAREFRVFYLMNGSYPKMTFKEWLAKKAPSVTK